MSSVTKPNHTTQEGFWSTLLQFSLYKPTQGRIVRQITFAALALLACMAAYELHNVDWITGWFLRLTQWGTGGRWLFLVLFAMIGFWIGFRVVNYPRFADFLISVEAEMNKVSWPGKTELWRASVVVIFVIFAMAGLLFLFDVMWAKFFEFLGIRYLG